MMPRRSPFVAALVVAALGVGASAADAQQPILPGGVPVGGVAQNGQAVAGPCGQPVGSFQGIGRAAGIDTFTCLGAGLSFVGPAVGQVSSVVGPTIISPGFIGTTIVTSGNVGIP